MIGEEDLEVGMAIRNWETLKVCYCHHVAKEVSLEAQLVYPSETQPDQPPRVLAQRCSNALACNLDGRASCIWAGTNPTFDPFAEGIR